jgi:hypothetical protein
VAMWRLLEIFLHEWVPIRRRCRILAKLAEMRTVEAHRLTIFTPFGRPTRQQANEPGNICLCFPKPLVFDVDQPNHREILSH